MQAHIAGDRLEARAGWWLQCGQYQLCNLDQVDGFSELYLPPLPSVLHSSFVCMCLFHSEMFLDSRDMAMNKENTLTC